MFASINLSTGQNSGGSEDGDGKHARQSPVRQDSTARKCPDDGVQLSKGPLRQDSTARKCSDDGVQLSKGPLRQDSTTRKSLDGDGGGDEVPTRHAQQVSGLWRRRRSTVEERSSASKLDDWKVFRCRECEEIGVRRNKKRCSNTQKYRDIRRLRIYL